MSQPLNKLNETLDEDDESNYDASSTTFDQQQQQHQQHQQPSQPEPALVSAMSNERRSKKIISNSSFNTSQSSQVSNMSRVEMLRNKYNQYDTISTTSQHDIVKSVKFKEPIEKSDQREQSAVDSAPSDLSPARKLLKNQEFKLMQVLDKALVSTPASLTADKPSPPTVVVTTPIDEDQNKNIKKLNVKFGESDPKKQSSSNKLSPKFKSAFNIGGNTSTTSIDKPPKPPVLNSNAQQQANSNANGGLSGLRSKLSGLRSRTMDAYDSHRNNSNESQSNSNSNASAVAEETATQNDAPTAAPLVNSSGKPIQSILRRSETPPASKTSLRQQTSLDSHKSYREESIEKILNATSSTSRPLMFKN
jgi:hypothetical protein